MQTATASWYNAEAEPTASGAHYRYGIANLSLPFGTRVRLCFQGCVTATVDDRGPYVSGRLFDLNEAVKATIGCSDLCEVHWRLNE